MPIKYVEVTTYRSDTWLVKLDTDRFLTKEDQEAGALDAVMDEVGQFEEVDFRFPSPEEDLKYCRPEETLETLYARHNGKDHLIDWTGN